MAHVKDLGEEKEMIAFNPNAKAGERFALGNEKGQPQNGSLELASVTRLIQIALLLSYSIAELAPAVKEGNQNG